MPDKLYCWRGVLGSLYSSPSKQKEVNTEEYIRKGALLEWAENIKRSCKGAVPTEKAYQTMIDKLNSI